MIKMYDMVINQSHGATICITSCWLYVKSCWCVLWLYNTCEWLYCCCHHCLYVYPLVGTDSDSHRRLLIDLVIDLSITHIWLVDQGLMCSFAGYYSIIFKLNPTPEPPPPPPVLKNYRATYGVVSWSVLLKRGRKGNRRHHSHWLPLLRLLPDVNGLSGEGLKGRAETGEHVALLVSTVLRLHGRREPQWTGDEYALPLHGKGRNHLTEPCAAVVPLSQSAPINKKRLPLIGRSPGA